MKTLIGLRLGSPARDHMGSPYATQVSCPVIAQVDSPYGPQLDPVEKTERAPDGQPTWGPTVNVHWVTMFALQIIC